MHSLYNGGASDAEVKVALAIPPARALSNDLWGDMQDRFPEFSEAVQEGHVLAEAWWAKQGRRALFLPEGVKFNATYVFCMTNRFKNYRRNPEPPVSARAPTETDNKGSSENHVAKHCGDYLKTRAVAAGTSER